MRRRATYSVTASLEVLDLLGLECGHGDGLHSMAELSAEI